MGEERNQPFPNNNNKKKEVEARSKLFILPSNPDGTVATGEFVTVPDLVEKLGNLR